MKHSSALVLLLATLLPAAQAGAATSPISKVVQLLSDLQAKITAEGEAAHKTFLEFSDWCKDRSTNLGFEITTGKAEVEDLKALIAKEASLSSSLVPKIEDLAADIATDNADLKAATKIRTMEAADFAAEAAELDEIISTLQRAIGILEREMAKGGAAMLQMKNAVSVTQAFTAMVEASVLSSADAGRLTALVQSSQSAENDEGDLGAPDAAVYKGHSGDIIGTLQDLLTKAEDQLSDARKKETSNVHNFEMLKQSLEDEIKVATKDMDKAKTGLAASSETKAGAEGDLAVATKGVEADIASLESVHQDCGAAAEDYEAGVKSRGEELQALAEAKKVIMSETGGAEGLTYSLSQVSLLQVGRSGLNSAMDSPKFQAVRFVRDLAEKQASPALAQLASRMAAAVQSSVSSGEDPFGKVKGLITDLIAKLEEEAGADATHKAYCDKELAETKVKQDDKTGEIEKLSVKVDQMTARSVELKGEVAALQKALSELAAAQAEMDKLRQEENAEYVKNKADLEQGIDGVKVGLNILREYYGQEDKAHAAAEGAGSGIIGLLEVIESDFTKGLSEMVSIEESAVAAYDKGTKENAIEKTAKDQDVKYKTKEATDLDKAVSETTSDRSGVQAELDAVLEYLASLEKQCIAKPEAYEERKGRREAELAGLKEALSILEGEAMLIQKQARRTLRGVHPHVSTA